MTDTSRTDTPPIQVERLTKVFRDFWRRPKARAVDGIDLEIARGEIFGLLGPNGSGKTTTLKILLGLLHPTSGTVRVLGRPPRDVGMKQRIGYVPEESCLYRYLTPREALDFYGSLFGYDRRRRALRSAQLLDMMGLAGAADRPIGEFSKGMARRVGLAQALLNDPDLILLDEPTAGLDPMGCRQVKDLLLALARRGRTILLSSHLLADVEDICDRVAIMYQGRLRAGGVLRNLLERKDRLRLTLPAPGPDATRELLAWIRTRLGREPELDRPSVNLEQFFLEVVAEARRSSEPGRPETPDGQMAAFLADHE